MSSILTTILITIMLIFIIRIYNKLVALKNQVDAAWSDISVQLKRRHDLIPKLVDVVQQYAQYEQAVLTRVTTLRSESKKLEKINEDDLKQTGLIEQQLEQQIKQLVILAEDYPDLKASEHFIELQKELSIVEDTLQYARRFYNGAVRLLNTQIDSFPDLIMAKLFNYQYRQYFQMERDL
ncbi:MAG: LemA family protein [Proteobacteria bacterium]|nr:LemA family protein [Pseudomonadota bacterium]